MTIQQRIQQFLWGQVDTRYLSMYRVGFALILLKDVLYGFAQADLYTDGGFIARALMVDLTTIRWSWLYFNGSAWYFYAFLGVWALILLAVLVGWRTRTMLMLSVLCLGSLMARNPLAINGGDQVLLAMNVWLLFLRVDGYYSVDAHHGRGATHTAAFPLRVAQVYFISIYGFTILHKTLRPQPLISWWDGNALYHILQQTSYISPIGEWLWYTLPAYTWQILTHGTLIFEASFVVIMLGFFWNPALRALALISGLLFHMGIAIVMAIRNFAPVMIWQYLIFLPPLANTPQNLTRADRLRALIACGLLLIYLWWGVHNVARFAADDQTVIPAPPSALVTLIQQVGIAHEWAMFASPSIAHVYTRVTIQTDTGHTHDAFSSDTPRATPYRVWWGIDRRYVRFYQEMMGVDEDLQRSWALFYCHAQDAAIIRIDRYRVWTINPDETAYALNRRQVIELTCP